MCLLLYVLFVLGRQFAADLYNEVLTLKSIIFFATTTLSFIISTLTYSSHLTPVGKSSIDSSLHVPIRFDTMATHLSQW